MRRQRLTRRSSHIAKGALLTPGTPEIIDATLADEGHTRWVGETVTGYKVRIEEGTGPSRQGGVGDPVAVEAEGDALR